MDREQLIKRIQIMDIHGVIEQNPRRPFDNETTCRLLIEEVDRIINEDFNDKN